MRNTYILFTALLAFLFACTPEKVNFVQDEPFILKSAESLDMPIVVVNPATGGTFNFIVFTSNRTDSIASIKVLNRSHDFAAAPIACRMIDPAKPVTVGDDGSLSRRLTTFIFEYSVTFPKTFRTGTYSVEFEVTSGRGEKKTLKAECTAVDYLQVTTSSTVYNGQVASSMRSYLSTAPCFLGLRLNTVSVIDSTVSPPVPTDVPSTITGLALTAATAATTANRPNVFAHIYSDVRDFNQRRMYLVSPDSTFVRDSLRALNGVANFNNTIMNKVRFVDLGTIDFVNLKSSDFDNIDFAGKGKGMVELLVNHSYAFQRPDGRIGIAYVKNIQVYSPEYNRASPFAAIQMKLKL